MLAERPTTSTMPNHGDGAFFLTIKVVTSRGDNKKHSVNVAARSAAEALAFTQWFTLAIKATKQPPVCTDMYG